ncbi:LysR family transcriptional regulator [Stenotrophomonas rhizophila]|uniref:LysR family transcriptional regulator n=1 Tax=Stenotrophomonas rhizophila TaxID=216778 RepID=UPI001E297E8D|nr:LysR family transcriptional regulator [Stenotrophomonas rhizophila]MCC7632863.1 LysR family transcriptional regulator [Stenotrophomonas rhizophila]MCC7662412.1 LysR family transcriptional regulator [Stenotrophomonas rhizophila]
MSDRPLPPLNALRSFEATARLGGVGRAAQALHVTHGAISRQLRVLEDHLGVALFERDGRGLRLTRAGATLQTACAGAFEQLHGAVDALKRQQRPEALVLGCSGSILARWMIPRLQALQADLPQLPLHWSAQDGSFTDAQRGLDAVLLLAQPPWPRGWQVRELAPERVGVVVSPQHPAAARLHRQPPSALLDEALLHTASRPQAWPAWAQAQGLDPAQLQLGSGFEHLYYLLEAAVAGLGVAIAPEPLVADELAAGRLLAPWGFAATGGFWVLATPDGAVDARVDVLAGWLQHQLAG